MYDAIVFSTSGWVRISIFSSPSQPQLENGAEEVVEDADDRLVVELQVCSNVIPILLGRFTYKHTHRRSPTTPQGGSRGGEHTNRQTDAGGVSVKDIRCTISKN